jgi:hypothetical protein
MAGMITGALAPGQGASGRMKGFAANEAGADAEEPKLPPICEIIGRVLAIW